MIPVKHEELTYEQKKEALGYLIYPKRRRCDKNKGRRCADGRTQCTYISRDELTLPSVSTNAEVLPTAVIDVWEDRNVVIMDMTGLFMQADINDLVHVRFHGEMVDKLFKIDCELCSPYVVQEEVCKALYIEVLKDLYGTLKAARLFWEILRLKLTN